MEPTFSIRMFNPQYPDESWVFMHGLTRPEAVAMFEPDDPNGVALAEFRFGRAFVRRSLHIYRSIDGKLEARIIREQ